MSLDAEIKVYPSKEITAQDFAILIEHITPDVDGVLEGCNVTKSGKTLSVSEGWCVVHGRIVKIEDGSVTLNNNQFPSSGSVTRYLTLKLDLHNASDPANLVLTQTIPADTSNFNTNPNTAVAYMKLATLRLTSSGISDVTNVVKMQVKSDSYYTRAVSKQKVFNQANNSYTLRLTRWNNLVTCSLFYTGSIPKNKVNKELILGSAIIPSGYRPWSALESVRMPYFQVAGHNINGARGQWIIYPNGDVKGNSNTEVYCERYGTMTWITMDDYPALTDGVDIPGLLPV